jgi:hypothetical protein
LERYAALRESEDMQAWGGYALHEAIVFRAEGKPRAALEALEPVLSGREGLGVTFLHVKLSLVEALESAFALGDTVKLGEMLGIVDALRPGERPPLLAAHAARFRALSTATPDEADAGFVQAAGLFRELEMTFWLAVAQLEHSERLIQQDRHAEAQPLITEAHETFERLKAKPWLERLDAAQAGTTAAIPA